MYKLPLTELIKFLSINNVTAPYHKLDIYDQVIETMKLPHVKTEMMTDYFTSIITHGKPYKSSEIFLYGTENKSRTIRMLGFNNRLINDMNVFNLLPNELVLEILVKTDYNSIKSFCLVNQEFYFYQRKITKLKQSINKFPRPEGKCQYHKIPKDVIDLGKVSLDLARKQLLDLNLDAVRGDIVELEQYRWYPYEVIYDGQEFIEMGYMTGGEGYLESDFEVINDDVPIDYWEQTNFKLANVLDQCVNNIQCGKITNNLTALFTTFVVNNLTYKIIYNVEPDLKYRMEFIRNLHTQSLNYSKKICPDQYTLYFRRNEQVNYKYVVTGASFFITNADGTFSMNSDYMEKVLKSDSEI